MSVGTLLPWVPEQFFDDAGDPLAGGLVYFYAAGTTTPQDTFSDVSLSPGSANANPVVLDSSGKPTSGAIYLSPTSYKVVIKTSAGTTLRTRDNVGAIPSTTLDLDIAATAGEALFTGTVVYLSAGDGSRTAGRWYATDADFTYASVGAAMLGMVQSAITSGEQGTVRLFGRITGLSGLTAGVRYYTSATAGALTATAPQNGRFIGVADSTTSLVMAPNPPVVPTTVLSKSANFTALVEDGQEQVFIIDATAGAVTLTLYATAGSAGRRIRVKKIDASANTVTLDGNGSESIDGATTAVLGARFDWIDIVSFGSSWGILSRSSAPGTVLQVVNATIGAAASSSSATYADTGLTATITPKSASSKILVTAHQAGLFKTGNVSMKLKLMRGVTDLLEFEKSAGNTGTTLDLAFGSSGTTYLDSPASISAQTYKTQFASVSGAASVSVQYGDSTSSITLMEIAQ